MKLSTAIFSICAVGFSAFFNVASYGAEFVGSVVDADTGIAIPARVYVHSSDGEWLFVESDSTEGNALPYREQWVPIPNSVEKHTTISAHPFRIDLKSGRYTITIERGKEYLPLTESIVIADQETKHTFRLKRWVNMAQRGWYSGETHVHRRIKELPNVMLAEDLNVAFPVTFWTVNAYASPDLEPSRLRRQGPSPFGPRTDRGHAMITVDPSHVIFPRNTEYEVFYIDGKRHTLGAVFILNHKTVFQKGMPPVAEIAEQARREGALLDLDKHSWPWSMMLVPIAKVDLFELANNSVWRTNFGFRRSSTAPAKYMKIETAEGGMTEAGWLNFGFENYYTLLNCGFRLQPTAGTASGVHPVPLGYSRAYVHVGEQFDAEKWLDGLRTGRSFVTNGPMLFATTDNQHPGKTFQQTDRAESQYRLSIESVSSRLIDRVEIIINGRIHQTIKPTSKESENRTSDGAYELRRDIMIPIKESSWIAVRSFQFDSDRRVQFAHTAPWHVEVGGEKVRPHKQEVEFLIRRVRDEITRNADVLPKNAMAEYHKALAIYESILENAKE